MTNIIPEVQLISNGVNFPLYISGKDKGLFEGGSKNDYAISDFAIAYFNKIYNKKNITKEALFFYIYDCI